MNYIRHLICAIICSLCLSACHQTQTITSSHNDTIYRTLIQHDSIDRYHTSYIYLQGDTVHHIDTISITKYITRTRDSIRIIHDTIRQTIASSIEQHSSPLKQLKTYLILLAISILTTLAFAIYLIKR